MRTLRIFEGKQRDYNIQALTLLYDNGPLSVWELTKKIPSARGRRQSLHATLNKRLRELEKKGYVRREDRKWYLRFKGIIALLLIMEKPRIWNPQWKEIFEHKAEIIESTSVPLLKRYGLTKENIHSARKRIGLNLDNLENWVELTKKAKSLMENGLLDFDVIKEETLFGLIVMETMSTEELSDIWNTDSETNPR